MRTRSRFTYSLYWLGRRLRRRHGKLLIAITILGHTLGIVGWIMLIPPDNVWVEAGLILLISSWVYYPARLADRRRWRVVLPLWTAAVLVLARTGNFDAITGVFMLGALGLIAFVN